MALCGSGGAGCDMHVCSMHVLRELIISWKRYLASCHWWCVSCFCFRMFVRLAIARFCLSKKVMCRVCRLVSDIG